MLHDKCTATIQLCMLTAVTRLITAVLLHDTHVHNLCEHRSGTVKQQRRVTLYYVHIRVLLSQE
jgi:coenzyme F420-reducing hydrogenase delta subunit